MQWNKESPSLSQFLCRLPPPVLQRKSSHRTLSVTDWTLKTSIREFELIQLNHCWTFSSTLLSLSSFSPSSQVSRDLLCQRWVTSEICRKYALSLFPPTSSSSLFSLHHWQICSVWSIQLLSVWRNIQIFSVDTIHSCCSSSWSWLGIERLFSAAGLAGLKQTNHLCPFIHF